jgi:hypothetical protein
MALARGLFWVGHEEPTEPAMGHGVPGVEQGADAESEPFAPAAVRNT